jgi:hypothetical protein
MRSWLLFALAGVVAAGTAQAAVKISSKPTQNMSCTAGVCTPTSQNANLNATDLANMLAIGDATVKTTSQAKDIEIDAALSWISASRLTVDSYRAITVGKFVSIKGPGALTLMTDDGGTGGDLDFENAGRIAFWDMSSSLIINGASYTLEPDFTTLVEAMLANPAGRYALAGDSKARRGPYRQSPVDLEFDGTLEGLGNTITGLSLAPVQGTAAMITTVGMSGTVRDLSLVKLSIEAHARHYGGLRAVAGLAGTSLGAIDGVHVSGTLNTSNDYLAHFGLLAADNSGIITKSSASGVIAISGTNSAAGGLVGEGGNISWSHADVDITGVDYTGGLVGSGSNIYDCYATGNVSGGLTGGLVGASGGAIVDSFATGNVSGGAAGGLFGSGDGIDNSITHVYSTGSVSSSGYSGGLGAVSDGASFDQAYSIGAVTTQGSDPPGGLIAGDYSATFSASVWDMDTSGITNPAQGAGNIADVPGITGLSDAALKSGLPSGFDPVVWGQNPSINGGYPYLLANPPPQ